ncbi:hypothetical protein QWZ13_08155 [Reinekea marina]|uniref:hypothetical protein n=1 Tax=Reinekea marina TaxID=1310421 RepID=UPI0025B3C692|nr:hypothetical protein [Reinekea marina]MDN3648882.1 hypothetical protein [Reinekea marina]
MPVVCVLLLLRCGRVKNNQTAKSAKKSMILSSANSLLSGVTPAYIDNGVVYLFLAARSAAMSDIQHG